MAPVEPAAFMSYVRFDDQHDDGQLTTFRERLAAEVRAQSGHEFPIFQDRTDIAWGQNWQQRIDEALDAVTLLVVIVTPSLFRSDPCRAEFRRFRSREEQLGRSDLILPVYYIGAREMESPAARDADDMATVLASRQLVDWRELRFEPFASPLVRRSVAQLASRMHDTVWQEPAAPVRPVEVVRPGAPPERTGDQAEPTGPPKIEPPTLVVDPFPGRGDFTRVGAAVDAARPGSRILVRPGVYDESVRVVTPLEILGDGPASEIVIRARGPQGALMFRAGIGRVANLTLRHRAGAGEWYCVDIGQGRLDLEGCDISSETLACVAVHSGADPHLRRNTIHDGQQVGVFVFDGGLGTLEDNDITGNGYAGVEIRTGGSPTLRRNHIHANRSTGVFVDDGGAGTLEDNDVIGNARSGVQIKARGNPTLRRNHVHDNREAGIVVNSGGAGVLEENDVAGNAYSGVEIQTGGTPTLRRNRIRNNRASGVLVRNNGRGTLDDNDITGNVRAGVEIRTGGDPSVRRNRITGNGGDPLWVHDGGRGTIEGNET